MVSRIFLPVFPGVYLCKGVVVAARKPAKKAVAEKKTGERYKSKAAMARHERSESKSEQKREYGKVKRTPKKGK